MVRIGLAAARAGASELVVGVADVALAATEKESVAAIDSFWKREDGRQKAMADFGKALKDLTSPSDGKEITPLVIVIDELDRCRPDYALQLLEVIKHFFSVDHVHFVLGVNLSALENSVRARYGKDIDAFMYLQKFISFRVSLTDISDDRTKLPTVIKYVSAIGILMSIPPHILNELQKQIRIISRNNPVSIRDAQKILSQISITPLEALQANNLIGWRMLFVTLIILKCTNNIFYRAFSLSKINDADLVRILTPPLKD